VIHDAPRLGRRFRVSSLTVRPAVGSRPHCTAALAGGLGAEAKSIFSASSCLANFWWRKNSPNPLASLPAGRQALPCKNPRIKKFLSCGGGQKI